MLPTPASKCLVEQRRLDRQAPRVEERSKFRAPMVSGSAPGPSNAAALRRSRNSRRPNRRGSTKRSSRPLARLSRACVCVATGESGVVTSSRPVMPRCTIHCASGSGLRQLAGRFSARSVGAPGKFGAGGPNSKTMCFPVRCTASTARPSRPWPGAKAAF